MTYHHHENDLEQLSRLLAQLGFRTRPVPYFTPSGIMAYTAVADALLGDVMQEAVFLSATPDGWQARITEHGGAQWTRDAEDIDALERIALEALRRTTTPPSSAWIEK